MNKKKIITTLTDDELTRWNHMRWRANVPDLTKEEAQQYLNSLDPITV